MNGDLTALEEWNRLLLAEVSRLAMALEFYANPATYHACSFMFDPPTGGFDEDFDEDHGDAFYDRPMPGKLARAALSVEATP